MASSTARKVSVAAAAGALGIGSCFLLHPPARVLAHSGDRAPGTDSSFGVDGMTAIGNGIAKAGAHVGIGIADAGIGVGLGLFLGLTALGFALSRRPVPGRARW